MSPALDVVGGWEACAAEGVMTRDMVESGSWSSKVEAWVRSCRNREGGEDCRAWREMDG